MHNATTIPIVIPTVSPDRDVYRRSLIASLVRQGFGSIVVERHAAGIARGPQGQGITARRGIVRALATRAPAILVLEDDVWISPRLTPRCLQSLAAQQLVITLYLAAGQRFWAPCSEAASSLAPVVNQTHWYGGQAILLPRPVAMHVAHLAESTIHALDWEVRDYLDRRGAPLYASVPNLVQHRAPPSINQTPGNASGRHVSATFR